MLNILECSKNYNDNMFSIVGKGRNMYNLSFLESLFIKTNKPRLFKKNVYYSILFNLL